jgi:hypothetical protein
MPTTASSLLIVLFAVLPGVPGESIYRRLAGTDWREDRSDKVLRIVGFSISGLVIYIIASALINAPMPDYIFPTTFQKLPLDRGQLIGMAFSLAGHFACAVLAGAGSGAVVRFVDRRTSVTGYPDSWDKFAKDYVANHWVIVRLENGQAYAGMLERADTSVRQNERDMILSEPAKYINANYKALPYQHLFLPGALIDSVAVVHDPDLDERITKVGDPIFPT